MTNQIQIDQIIDYMNSVSAITSLVGNRIYRGSPFNEDNSPTATDYPYIIVNIISESNAEFNKWTLLEFVYVNNKDGSFKSLMDVRKTVVDNLLWQRQLWLQNVYNITEEAIRQWFDTKDQKLVIQDMRFNFIT